MHIFSLRFVLGFAGAIQAAAVPKSHVLHEKRDGAASKHWVKREKLSPGAMLPMRIGLMQSNLDYGYQLLMDISDPASPSYAKHWTSEEVVEKFAPDQETIDTVTAWLTTFGIEARRITHSDNKGWLAFDATTAEAEGLLHTEYQLYEHESEGHLLTACENYYVPKHIQEHVDYITPGIKLFAPTKRGLINHDIGAESHGHLWQGAVSALSGFPPTAAGELSRCHKWITPACIRALYGVPLKPEYLDGEPRADNALGIFETGDTYAQGDMDLFFSNFTSYIPNGTHPVLASIDGGYAPVDDVLYGGGESALNFQLAYPLVYPQSITLYQTDDEFYTGWFSPTSGAFNTFLDAIDGSYCTYEAFGEIGNDPKLDPTYPNPYDKKGYQGQLMCGVYTPANVISVSYGGQEVDLPAYYQQRQCNEFLKLGLQGVSLIWASGDSGVAGPRGSHNSNGCLGSSATIFSPTWPNSCPYITNVGATKVYPNRTVYEPESAVVDPIYQPYWSAYSSGGGFSNIYPVPNYQHGAVASFFANHNPSYKYYEGNFSNGGVHNRTGRGIPDVAANGDNIPCFSGGEFGRTGGTSASAPIFASLINRINEQRLNAGKTTLGFLNPALYANPSMLNDIMSGTNPGCGTVGFASVPGWDPVTGLGTPNYPKMLAYFMSLP